jgi:cytochrome c peroxidase
MHAMTADEMAGYQLFDGKGNCNSCHVTEEDDYLASQTDTSKPPP